MKVDNCLFFLMFLLFVTSCGRDVKKEYYPDGSLYLEYEVKDGEKHGMYKSYHKKGSLKHKGKYQNGERHGRHFWLRSDGDTQEIADYKNGVLHGVVKKFHPNGTIKSKMEFDNGDQIGLAKSFYDDGSKKGVANYSKGKREGKAEFFFRDGKLKAKSFAVRDCVIFYQEYYKGGDTIKTLRDLVIIGPDTMRSSDEKYIAKVHLGGLKDTTVGFDARTLSFKNKKWMNEYGFAAENSESLQVINGVGTFEFVPKSPVLPYYHLSVRGEFEGRSYLAQKTINVEYGDVKNFKAYRDSSEKERVQ